MICDANSLLTGIYVVLYSLAVFVLVKRKTPGHKIHLGVLTTLFLLSTTRIGAVWSTAIDQRYNYTSVVVVDGVVSKNHSPLNEMYSGGLSYGLIGIASFGGLPVVTALTFLLAK